MIEREKQDVRVKCSELKTKIGASSHHPRIAQEQYSPPRAADHKRDRESGMEAVSHRQGSQGTI